MNARIFAQLTFLYGNEKLNPTAIIRIFFFLSCLSFLVSTIRPHTSVSLFADESMLNNIFFLLSLSLDLVYDLLFIFPSSHPVQRCAAHRCMVYGRMQQVPQMVDGFLCPEQNFRSSDDHQRTPRFCCVHDAEETLCNDLFVLVNTLVSDCLTVYRSIKIYFMSMSIHLFAQKVSFYCTYIRIFIFVYRNWFSITQKNRKKERKKYIS